MVHLAGQPGVRASFGAGFAGCAADNLGATQAVLEAARATGARRVVWASSSSVYGDAPSGPAARTRRRAPRSPYGVTKLACEGLAPIARSGGLSVTGLRYFTVYGPRQRPDMAVRRMCEALAGGPAFPLLGDGDQSRDVTHVADAADATLRAATAAEVADVYNVGGGQEASLAELMAELAALAGRPVPVLRRDPAPGDVRHTAADTTRARRELGWRPRVGLREGLAGELAWVRSRTGRFARRDPRRGPGSDGGGAAALTPQRGSRHMACRVGPPGTGIGPGTRSRSARTAPGSGPRWPPGRRHVPSRSARSRTSAISAEPMPRPCASGTTASICRCRCGLRGQVSREGLLHRAAIRVGVRAHEVRQGGAEPPALGRGAANSSRPAGSHSAAPVPAALTCVSSCAR